MAKVIGVRFKNAGKLYYFDPGSFWPEAGEAVIVETEHGVAYGRVITGVKEVEDETLELKPVIRIADEQDARHQEENERFEKEAFDICRKKIEEHELEMKLVGAEETFDNAKLLFYFTANGRVDFRMLVKDLASVFHTRIELRQIGVRDEAKMLGGLGPCGRPICCGKFLGDFQAVGIKMAKDQNLSLNPTKISGVCGRLMCCLTFEEEHYESARRRMPRIGKDVETPEGFGSVSDINVLKETVTVRLRKGDSFEQKTFALEELKWQAPARPAREAEAEEEVKPRPRGKRPFQERGEQPVRAENDNAAVRPSRAEKSERSERPERPVKNEKPAEKAEKPAPQNDWMRAVEEALQQAEKKD